MAHRLPLADIKFIADFAAFCRGKGDEEYDYWDIKRCAGALFLIETGRAPNGCAYSTNDYYLKDAAGKVGTQTAATWSGFSGFLYDAGVLAGPDGKPLTARPDFATWFTAPGA